MLLGYFFIEFLLFCQKVDCFYPLNRNDDLGVGVGVGILGILRSRTLYLFYIVFKVSLYILK